MSDETNNAFVNALKQEYEETVAFWRDEKRKVDEIMEAREREEQEGNDDKEDLPATQR